LRSGVALNEVEAQHFDRYVGLFSLINALQCVKGIRGMKGIMPPKGFRCKRCGRCCLKLGDEIGIRENDIFRWKKQGRKNILAWVYIYPFKNPRGDAWFHPRTTKEVDRCPWLKRLQNKKYICTIQNTKPEACKEFPESKEHAEKYNCPGFKKCH